MWRRSSAGARTRMIRRFCWQRRLAGLAGMLSGDRAGGRKALRHAEKRGRKRLELPDFSILALIRRTFESDGNVKHSSFIVCSRWHPVSGSSGHLVWDCHTTRLAQCISGMPACRPSFSIARQLVAALPVACRITHSMSAGVPGSNRLCITSPQPLARHVIDAVNVGENR